MAGVRKCPLVRVHMREDDVFAPAARELSTSAGFQEQTRGD